MSTSSLRILCVFTGYRFSLSSPAMFRLFFWRVYVLRHVHKLGPAWLRRFIVNVLPMRRVHDLRDKVDLMWANSKEIYSQKLEALRSGDEAVTKQVGQGKDILSLLSMC